MSELSDAMAEMTYAMTKVVGLLDDLMESQTSQLDPDATIAPTDRTYSLGSKVLNPENLNPSPKAKYQYSKSFLEFWDIYPRHTDKHKSCVAWRNAVARCDIATVADGATQYRNDPNRVDAFTKIASTWLNGDCWEDDPLPPRSVDPKEAERAAREEERQRRIEAAKRLAESTRGQE